MRSLHLKIYFSLIGVVVVCLFVALVSGRALLGSTPKEGATILGQLIGEQLDLSAEPAELQATVDRLSADYELDLRVQDAEGNTLASTGDLWDEDFSEHRGMFKHRRRFGVVVSLDDGASLAVAHRISQPQALAHLAVLFALLVVMLIGCYPLARSITGRLNRLELAVEDWGEGDLSSRVTVRGRDEVASLARSFNSAADQVEQLVEGQQRLLANVSHELRSPLARLRVAIELLNDENALGVRYDQLVENIAQLDELIGELLLSSRLESVKPTLSPSTIRLSDLVEEEATQAGATLEGGPLEFRCDTTLMKRAVRNLIDNASRYASEISVRGSTTGQVQSITVSDRGPGVPDGEKDRIFEPFYRPHGHAEGAHGGVGLGLALVRQIAQLHGGDVSYRDRDGGGSVFELSWPVTD